MIFNCDGYAFMDMDIQKRLQMLIQYIRQSRKRVVVTALIASTAAVFIFILGSYYLLFDYYEQQQKGHYTTILKNISLLQAKLITKGTYREDIIALCTSLARQRGVLNAWVTDKFGRLMYHTDSNTYAALRSKRLTSEYYESIQHSWEFSEGTPVMNDVLLQDRLSMRVTIPLYPFGREDYDFILGMDVKRFVSLPATIRSLVLISAGYLAGSILLLFLPVFLWVRNRFQDLVSHSRVLIGPLGFEGPQAMDLRQPPASARKETVPAAAVSEAMEEEVRLKLQKLRELEEERKKRATEERPKEVAGAGAVERGKEEVEEEIEPGVEEGEEAGEEIAVEEERPGKEVPSEAGGEAGEEAVIREEVRPEEKKILMEETVERVGVEEVEVEKRLERFVKLRSTLFKKQTLELPFIQAHSYIFHSKGVEGSFIFYHKSNDRHFYVCFSLSGAKPERLFELIPETRTYMKKILGKGRSIKELYIDYNEYCLQKTINSHLALLHIDEAKTLVEFASCGGGYALYLKGNEEEVKDLVFDLPAAGTLHRNDLERVFYSADVRFSPNDIFALLPKEASTFSIGKKRFDELVRESLKGHRDLSPQTIGMDIVSSIEGFEPGTLTIPETGFILLKYL